MSDATYDLPLVQGERFTRTFAYADDGTAGSFADFDIFAEVRQKESLSATLVLVLTPHLTVSEDGATLTLDIPGRVMAAVDASLLRRGGFWDLFLVDKNDPDNSELFLQGGVTLDPATTRTVTE